MLKPILSIVIFTAIAFTWLLLIEVPQGFVCVKKRLGRLQKKIQQPGFTTCLPVIEKCLLIQTSIQTERIRNIPCGTSGGSLISFKSIEVVFYLDQSQVYQTVKNYSTEYKQLWIHDKIHHEVNQFCSRNNLREIFIDKFPQLDDQLKKLLEIDLEKWAPAIKILSVRVTKPKIPQKVAKSFDKMEKTRTLLRVVEQKQKNLLAQHKMNNTIKLIQAKSRLQVRQQQIRKQLKAKQNQLKMAKIQAVIELNKNKTMIDCHHDGQLKVIGLQPKFLSKKFLKFTGTDAMTQNNMIVFGTKIPDILLRNPLS